MRTASQVSRTALVIAACLWNHLCVGAEGPAPGLIAAVQKGDIELVKRHLAEGADVNAADANRWTPLMHAAYAGSAPIVSAILSSGPDVNAKNGEGWTALMLASYEGHGLVAQTLIGAKADVNASTAKGTTALISAAGTGRANVVRLLLDAGADLSLKDSDGKTALQYATEKGHPQVIGMLGGTVAAEADEPAELRIEGAPPVAAPLPSKPSAAVAARSERLQSFVMGISTGVGLLLTIWAFSRSVRSSSRGRSLLGMLGGLFIGALLVSASREAGRWYLRRYYGITVAGSMWGEPEVKWEKRSVLGVLLESPGPFVDKKPAPPAPKPGEPSPFRTYEGYEAKGGAILVVVLRAGIKPGFEMNLDRGTAGAEASASRVLDSTSLR